MRLGLDVNLPALETASRELANLTRSTAALERRLAGLETIGLLLGLAVFALGAALVYVSEDSRG